ncbi:hypothetical protein AUP68_17315 [Ilyonectria robusta]
MLAITEEENSKLSRGTSAPLYNSHGRVDGYYVVQTTMSHQLHCLWDGKTNSYRTDPHPTHSCRSWDAIWKWSAGRNKTGMRVHADHVKVFKEFQALHGTDMHSGHHAGHSD